MKLHTLNKTLYYFWFFQNPNHLLKLNTSTFHLNTLLRLFIWKKPVVTKNFFRINFKKVLRVFTITEVTSNNTCVLKLIKPSFRENTVVKLNLTLNVLLHNLKTFNFFYFSYIYKILLLLNNLTKINQLGVQITPNYLKNTKQILLNYNILKI